MEPHEEKRLLFLCQAVDTFGFEISSFVTVLLDFKMFENVFRCHFWQTWQVNKQLQVCYTTQKLIIRGGKLFSNK